MAKQLHYQFDEDTLKVVDRTKASYAFQAALAFVDDCIDDCMDEDSRADAV